MNNKLTQVNCYVGSLNKLNGASVVILENLGPDVIRPVGEGNQIVVGGVHFCECFLAKVAVVLFNLNFKYNVYIAVYLILK